MIGNDIVDFELAKIETNWQRPRLLDKIFSTKEQDYIALSSDPFKTFWTLWAAKEAAYKLYTQLKPRRFYSPKGFICSIEGKSLKVSYQEFKCYVQTRLTSQYVLAEASLDGKDIISEVIVFDKKSTKGVSALVKQELLKGIAKNYQVEDSSLNIEKDDMGVPLVFLKSRKLNVSVTHHGRFGAYAFPKMPYDFSTVTNETA